MLNDFTDKMMEEYPPTLAIMVYESEKGDYYLESHEIKNGQIMEGKPLKEETIFGIAELFREKGGSQSNLTGIYPSCLLHFEHLDGYNYNMVWYRPEEQRVIHFSEDLHIPDGKVWVPPLIYQAKNKNLTVLALGSNDRPDLKTQLCKAPFHNTSDDGSVCLGNAKSLKSASKKTFQSEIEYWEDMFWNSKFSHLAGSSNPTKSNLSLIWSAQVQKGERFPMEELKPSRLTLKKLL